jgi:hypothetical protein
MKTKIAAQLLLSFILLGLFGHAANASVITNKYTLDLVVADDSFETRNKILHQALDKIIAKVGGNDANLDHGRLVAATENIDTCISHFTYTGDPGAFILSIHFKPAIIDELFVQAQTETSLSAIAVPDVLTPDIEIPDTLTPAVSATVTAAVSTTTPVPSKTKTKTKTKSSGVTLRVTGIYNIEDYARIMTHLKNMSSIKRVEVSGVFDNAATFLLTADGGKDAITQAISLEPLLIADTANLNLDSESLYYRVGS